VPKADIAVADRRLRDRVVSRAHSRLNAILGLLAAHL
jgi:hypothetical protein